jgi:hypothetical protein
MMLHAGVLDVVLQGGLQLSNVLLGVGIPVIPVSFIGHLDVLQAVVWRDLLVLRGKTHAGRLSGSHYEGLCMVVLRSRRENIEDAGC